MNLNWVMKMFKKLKILFLFFILGFCSACNGNNEALIEELKSIEEDNEELIDQRNEYKKLQDVFDFYNNVTTNNIMSFVLVESYNKSSNKKYYSDGVVIAQEGMYYYILVDYLKIKQIGNIEYKVIDANAREYVANFVFEDNMIVYDEFSGFALLEIQVNNLENPIVDIDFGDMSFIFANISSVEHLNKIQVYSEIKTSTIDYNDTSYVLYSLNDSIRNPNGVLVNMDNELVAMYSSQLSAFLEIDLILEIMYVTYALVV